MTRDETGANRGSIEAVLALHRDAPRDRARWALSAEEGTLYAIVDVARDPELLDLLDASGEVYCAFDETREPDDLGDTAPVLVELTPGAPTLATLLEEAWATGALVFVASELGFMDLYGHLLERAGVDPNATAPRFWAPATLRLLATRGDHGALFAGVTAFLAEGERPDVLARLTLADGAVHREDLPLT